MDFRVVVRGRSCHKGSSSSRCPQSQTCCTTHNFCTLQYMPRLRKSRTISCLSMYRRFCNSNANGPSNKYTHSVMLMHLPSTSRVTFLLERLWRRVGMMMSSSRRYPFTATQWQELEHQALVFKYMVSGMPIPPDLLFSIRTSLDSSSLSSNFLIHQPPHFGWSSFQMGLGRKIDPEPGRCRRTDGKKWRCSKEAFPDSKYCERHMHRGRNRSRKPVEILSPTTPASDTHSLYPRPPAFPETTNFFLHSRPPPKDCRSSSYGNGMKGESDEHEFFSNLYSSSKLESLTMSMTSQSQTKNNAYASDHRRLYSGGEAADEQQPKKVMHHFLDEWAPREAESWSKSEESMPSHRSQLSISVPNSLHDFFVTQKW